VDLVAIWKFIFDKFARIIDNMTSYTLFELNKLIRNTLDANLAPSYWVVAEIGEMRNNQKGHCYMELVEKAGEEVIAKIRANIWSYTYRNLSGWFEAITGQSLHAGIKILANVNVQYHELYGMCLVVKDIDPSYTLGERAKKRQEVIDRLKEDGVYDINRELPLPIVPQRIAVISSPTAAGYGDFINQLLNNRSNIRFQARLFKAMMQGSEAAGSIIQALHDVHHRTDQFDVVVIIRGGGAQVDLDCFDTYDLASHISQFPLPVITGIGHERDETIADLVAHTRLKTPTAVAEFLIGGARAFEENIDGLFRRLSDFSKNFIGTQKYMLDNLQRQLNYSCQTQLSQMKNDLQNLSDNLKDCVEAVVEKHGNRMDLLEKSIRYLDPANVLKRGYAIITYQNKIVKSIENVKQGDQIETIVKDGIITSTIEKTEKR
jgi:exodeoxyribonuclease VII large subunit